MIKKDIVTGPGLYEDRGGYLLIVLDEAKSLPDKDHMGRDIRWPDKLWSVLAGGTGSYVVDSTGRIVNSMGIERRRRISKKRCQVAPLIVKVPVRREVTIKGQTRKLFASYWRVFGEAPYDKGEFYDAVDRLVKNNNEMILTDRDEPEFGPCAWRSDSIVGSPWLLDVQDGEIVPNVPVYDSLVGYREETPEEIEERKEKTRESNERWLEELEAFKEYKRWKI